MFKHINIFREAGNIGLGLVILLNVFAAMPLVAPQQSYAAHCGTGTDGVTIEHSTNGLCIPRQAGSGISSTRNVNELIIRIINIILGISAAVAVLMIVIGGFRYIISAGDEKQSGAAKKTIINAVIGLVIIILAFAIVSVVNNTLTRR